MKHHEYFNTIWTHRDGKFWWDGVKSGFIYSMILTSCLWVNGIVLVNKIKECQKSKNEKHK